MDGRGVVWMEGASVVSKNWDVVSNVEWMEIQFGW